MIRVALAALAMGASGCFGTVYAVHPDADLAPELTTAAVAAAADWSANVPGHVAAVNEPCPYVREASDICVHAVPALPSLPWEPGIILGFTLGHDVWLATPLLEHYPALARQQIVAHELGHAMGLLHDAPGTLMAPYLEQGSSHVTAADVRQWQALRP